MRVLLALFLVALTISFVSCSKDKTDNQANRVTALARKDIVQPSVELQTLFLSAKPAETIQPDPTLVAVPDTQTVSAEVVQVSTPTPTATSEERVEPTPIPKVEAAAAVQEQPVRDQGVSNGPVELVLVTFYYCQRTVSVPDDGGGYCGHTATGVTVHPGTAACAISKLRQHFVFQDDPQNLIFSCEDTGSAVGDGHVDIWYMTNSEGYNSPLTGRGRNIIWQD